MSEFSPSSSSGVAVANRASARQQQDDRDRQLLDRAFQGDESAIDSLIAAHLPCLLGYFRFLRLSTEEAEDLTQESFLRMFRGLDTFDRNRPFMPWLMAIARNTFLDWKKTTSREQHKIQSIAVPEPVPSVENTVVSRIHAENLLNRLPPDARFLVEMRILYGWSFAELATFTGETEVALRSKLCRILKRLRGNLPVRARG